jgi:hypothetical protein
MKNKFKILKNNKQNLYNRINNNFGSKLPTVYVSLVWK